MQATTSNESNKNLIQELAQDGPCSHDVEYQPQEVPNYSTYRKGSTKAVKVILVCMYLFSVSLMAILLSLYYIFLWEAKPEEYDDPESLIGDGQIKENNDKIVIPERLAIELINKTEVSAEHFFENFFKKLVEHSKRKVKKIIDVTESEKLSNILKEYKELQNRKGEEVVESDGEDGGDDYEQSGNYELYSNNTAIILDQDANEN